MKKIFTVILILTQLSVFAQDSTTQISDVERVVDKYVDKTTEAIKGLAKALQVPAERVYGVIIKQQNIKAWSALATPISIILLMIFLLILGNYFNKSHWKHFEKSEYNDRASWDLDDSFEGIAQIFAFVIAAFLLLSLLLATDVLTITQGFMNPEYGAIKEISNLIK